MSGRNIVAVVISLGLWNAANGSEPAPSAEFTTLTPKTWDRFVPQGKEVDAIYDDLVLRNEHLVAVIAGGSNTRHANMTVRDVGGQLIDFTARDAQSDQLSAFYVGRRRFPLRGGQRGDDDDRQASAEFLALSALGRPAVKCRYELSPGSKFLLVETVYTNDGTEPLTVTLEDDVRLDAGRENARFSPNGRHDLFWMHDRHWGQAYGVEVEGRRVESTRGRSLVLRYVDESNSADVTIAPGESFTLTRRLYAHRDLLGVVAAAAKRAGTTFPDVTLTLKDAHGEPVPTALVSVGKGDGYHGTGVTDENGRLRTRLPAGEWSLDVTALGVAAGTPTIGVKPGQNTIDLALETFTPGIVAAKIVDIRGRPIPCKVEFRAQDGTPQPNFGPHTAAGGVGNLVYTADGTFEQAVPAGTYDVIVSHGPEFNALFKKLTVPPNGTVELTGRLFRSVDTSGWVSADFHSHSSPSGDNTGSQFGRVLNLLAEHVEFAPCTEHNRIDSYLPHIERLRAGRFIATTPGMELTGRPLPLNHQNTFPLVHVPRTQDGGGPVTDTDIERQVERLALWNDRLPKVMQQNHPDIGWLLYDRDGDGKPDGGHSRIVPHMDVMEIHPITTAADLGPVDVRDGKPFGNNRVFNWLQLLNQGYRIHGVVNTDAHYNFHGSGGLRNWIRSSTDEPGEIDLDEMVANSKAGRIVMSNGPFLEFTVRDADGEKTAMAGDDLLVKAGKVELHVKVQCPNWMEIDRVFVLENGRGKRFNYSRERTPQKFGDGTTQFDEIRTLTLKQDTHLIAIAVGSKPLGDVLGPAWGKQIPAAMTNPVFVDVDGGGFTPNEDTLGVPLPVKYGSRK